MCTKSANALIFVDKNLLMRTVIQGTDLTEEKTNKRRDFNVSLHTVSEKGKIANEYYTFVEYFSSRMTDSCHTLLVASADEDSCIKCKTSSYQCVFVA